MMGIKLLFLLIGALSVRPTHALEVDSLLQLVYQKIAVGKFNYQMIRELDYDMGDGMRDYMKEQWNTKIDFANDNLLGIRFEILGKNGFLYFNGEEYLEKSKDGIIKKRSQGLKALEDIRHLSPLYNSLVTIRNVIPLILRLDDISQEVKEEKEDYVFVCNLGNRRIQNLGTAFDKMTTEYDFVYRIYVDKASLMPYRIVQRYGGSEIRTTFEGITVIN